MSAEVLHRFVELEIPGMRSDIGGVCGHGSIALEEWLQAMDERLPDVPSFSHHRPINFAPPSPRKFNSLQKEETVNGHGSATISQDKNWAVGFGYSCE
jgi:hypothetical protein